MLLAVNGTSPILFFDICEDVLIPHFFALSMLAPLSDNPHIELVI